MSFLLISIGNSFIVKMKKIAITIGLSITFPVFQPICAFAETLFKIPVRPGGPLSLVLLLLGIILVGIIALASSVSFKVGEFFPDYIKEYWIRGIRHYKKYEYYEHIPEGWYDLKEPLWEDGFLASFLAPIHAVGFACLHSLKWLSQVPKGNNRFLKMEVDKESAYWIRKFLNLQGILKAVVKRTEDERDSTSSSLLLNEELGKGKYSVHLGVDPVEESVTSMSSSKKGGGVVTIYMDIDKKTDKGMQPVPDELYNFDLGIAPILKDNFSDDDLKKIDFTNIKLLAETIAKGVGTGLDGKKVVILMRDRHEEIISQLIKAGIWVKETKFQKIKEKVRKSEKGIYENGNLMLIEHGDLSSGLGLISGKVGAIVGAGRATEGAALANLIKCIGGKYRGRLCNEKLSYKFSSFERSLMKRCHIVEPGTEKEDQMPWNKVFTENDLCGDGDIVFYYGAIRDNYWMDDLKGAHIEKETGDGIINILRVTRAGMPRIYTIRYKTRISQLNQELANLKENMRVNEKVMISLGNACSRVAWNYINRAKIRRRKTYQKLHRKILDWPLSRVRHVVSHGYLTHYKKRIKVRIASLEKKKEVFNHALARMNYQRAKAYAEFGLFSYAIEDIQEACRIVSNYKELDEKLLDKYKKAENFFQGMKFLVTSKESIKAYKNAFRKFSLALYPKPLKTPGLVNPTDIMKKIGFFILNFEMPFSYPYGRQCEVRPCCRDIKTAKLFNNLYSKLEALYKDFPPTSRRDKAGYNLLIEHKKHLEWLLKWGNKESMKEKGQEFYAHYGESFSRMANEYYNLGYNLRAIKFFRNAIACFKRIPQIYRGYYLAYAQLRVAQCYEKIGFDIEAIEEYYKLLNPKEDIISGVNNGTFEDKIYSRFSALFKSLLPALRGYIRNVMRKYGATEDEIKNAIDNIDKESEGCHDVYIGEKGMICIIFNSGEPYQRKKKIYLKEIEQEALNRRI